MKNKARRNDIILIAALLAAALLTYVGLRLLQGGNAAGGVAVVTVDGAEYGRFPLNEDCEERIALSDGAYNMLVISNGRADITEASCPDKICVRHRAVSKKGQSIVCLPNKVVVEIEGGEMDDVDLTTH